MIYKSTMPPKPYQYYNILKVMDMSYHQIIGINYPEAIEKLGYFHANLSHSLAVFHFYE